MTDGKFLQIHTLTSYPGTLLNRDDAGFAKRLPFGGATRTRVSSQCLKYHWRNFDGEHALYELDVPRSLRSRETFRRRVAEPLIDEGYPAPLVRGLTLTLKEFLLTAKNATKTNVQKQIQPEEDEDPWEALDTNQITVFGEPEMAYLRELGAAILDGLKEELSPFWSEGADIEDELVAEAVDAVRGISGKDLRKNLRGMALASGLDAAMFGRMATSDILARGDAAVHVAHAFTTHEEESESDYFSAVDELRRDEPEESGELGAGHINSSELASGLFYSYVVVDVPLLVSNITGVPRSDWTSADRQLAAEVVRRFVHLVTTVSPGAKLGSTAPHSYAQLLFLEWGSAQPRTLANAFQRPASLAGEGVLANSYRALGRFMTEMDRMYGTLTERRLAAVDSSDDFVEMMKAPGLESVAEVAEWAGEQVRG